MLHLIVRGKNEKSKTSNIKILPQNSKSRMPVCQTKIAPKPQRQKEMGLGRFYKERRSIHFLSSLPLLLLLAFSLCNCGGSSTAEKAEYQHVDSLFLIPQPIHLEKREGSFKINSETYLTYANELVSEASYFTKIIDSASTFSLRQNPDTKINTTEIELKLVNDFPAELQNGEAYRLIISPEKMQITALTSTGIIRGIQTVRQLFIPAFHSGEKRTAWFLPCLKIEDKPAFEHRGLLLDVCRHFFEKEVIFKYIDALAFYKMNILHLHLTEDQGWRMQIDTYPLLNTISSFRTEKDGNIYGGFYTKEDLKEIVAYASERHIVVIPEIELPGHAQAALAAYPQYSCNSGPITVANDWGVFKEIYCAGNDSTFKFLEDVLTEVMEIFPSEYIHIGGDEAPKFRWEHCDKCQKRMAEEGLKDEHELQSYFIQRIEKFLNANGRKLIGWDEILEGGLSENATVQSWRGMDGGLTAAQQKHYVIMSPTSHCYLDYGLDAIDLKKVYSFNPVPENLQPEFYKYILGGEVNMWTEHVPDETDLDAKVFPRLIALAEVLWSGPDTARYDSFYKRIQEHYPILNYFGIKYGTETVPLKIETYVEDQTAYISINKNLPDLELKYRYRCEGCDTNLVVYKDPILLDRTSELEVYCYKDGKQYGPAIHQKLSAHLAQFSQVDYYGHWNDWYPAASETALIDGKLGSLNFRDGNWQGFWGKDAHIIINLDKISTISRVTLHFLEYSNAWIMNPKLVYVNLADLTYDGNWYSFPGKAEYKQLETKDGISISEIVFEFDAISTNAVSVDIFNYGKLPATHEAAGQDAWLFIDEIIVE
ncbi:MAG: beta-N-acetylhexosaminidase [Bacteroidetes bacterium]|nr:beta-N-acetylhexosaminidase [Bacteroidota bacterium]